MIGKKHSIVDFMMLGIFNTIINGPGKAVMEPFISKFTLLKKYLDTRNF